MTMTPDEMERMLLRQEKAITKLEEDMKVAEETRRSEREKQLKWGLRTMGLVILAMGGWIANQLSDLITFNIGNPK